MPEAATQVAPVAPIEPSKQGQDRWRQVMALPCRISIEVPVSRFAVKNLLQLSPQSIVSSETLTTANLPLKVNRELIGWCEFEVLGNRVAVRLTEIA